ncbi:MAG: leucyl/phenylalanyl-tRNA--protein transferase [Gammaproteobacteria bacterium]
MTGETLAHQIYWVADNRIGADFPPVEKALADPDGLLAIGGDLSPTRLLHAYQLGIFPWFSEGQPILWWSPDPRCVIRPGHLKISRSLRKTINSNRFVVTVDQAFANVVKNCAAPRDGIYDTWITADIKTAYQQLHELGHAHSVECWHDGELVGGLYGIAIGQVFFGESMFSRVSDASKVALAWLSAQLAAADFQLIDCQVNSPHLRKLGAELMPRQSFSNLLATACARTASIDWQQPGAAL